MTQTDRPGQVHSKLSGIQAKLVAAQNCHPNAVQPLIEEALSELEQVPLGVGLDEPSFQARVDAWLVACFGQDIARDKVERNHRFLEEALELAQACQCTKSEALQLVDYVFGRPVGEPEQEVGGVVVTLASLCLAHQWPMVELGNQELDRVWTKVEVIRAKQAAKPKFSPLPQHAQQASQTSVPDAVVNALNASLSACDRVIDQDKGVLGGIDFRALKSAVVSALGAIGRGGVNHG